MGFKQKFLYERAEWIDIRHLYLWIFDYRFQLGDTAVYVYPFVLHREAIQWQCFLRVRMTTFSTLIFDLQYFACRR